MVRRMRARVSARTGPLSLTTRETVATETRARDEAESIASRFHNDWWDAANGTYAMSLEVSTNAQRPVSHWAVVTPLEVGLALPAYAETTLATLRQSYLNDWGLKHTVGDDERVWTLPTAALSRASYRYDDTELGFEMLAPGIARHGYKAYAAGAEGIVTSGTQTPLLKKAVGLAYLPIAATTLGTEFEVDIRGRRTPARVVSRQFYKRPR